MIAAAVAMLGIATNAATCDWKTEWLYAIDESHATYEGTANFTGKFWVLMGDFSDITVNASGVLSASGTFNYVNSLGSEGDVVDVSGGIAGTIADLTEADNGSNIALVIFYDQEGGYYGFDTDVIAGIVDPNPGAGITGADATPVTFSTGYGDGMYLMGATTPTPEPTSGVLLLLGMAGLALRRRRA